MSIVDYVGGAGTESNVSYIEGFIQIQEGDVVQVRMQHTQNWSGRIELGENCGEYETLVTHYNGPGQATTSPIVTLPSGIHRIRVSSFDYDGANGNMFFQTSLNGSGFSTGINGILLSDEDPEARCFIGQQCMGGSVIDFSTGEIVNDAILGCKEDVSECLNCTELPFCFTVTATSEKIQGTRVTCRDCEGGVVDRYAEDWQGNRYELTDITVD